MSSTRSTLYPIFGGRSAARQRAEQLQLVGNVQVAAPVIVPAIFVLQLLHQLPERLAFLGHDVGQQQGVQDAVALGKMARDADAAGLFAADQDFAAAEHDVADVLEAYAVLDQFAMVFAGDAVEHAGGVEGAGDGAGPLLALEKPLQQHRETLVRVDEAAVLGDRADAVGIAIDRQAGAALFAHHGVLEGFHVRQNRLRVDAGKQRIHLSANLQVRNSGLLEDARQHSPPGSRT